MCQLICINVFPVLVRAFEFMCNHLYLCFFFSSCKRWSVQILWTLLSLIWLKVDKLAGMPSVHVVQRSDIKGCSFSSFQKRKIFREQADSWHFFFFFLFYSSCLMLVHQLEKAKCYVFFIIFTCWSSWGFSRIFTQ